MQMLCILVIVILIQRYIYQYTVFSQLDVHCVQLKLGLISTRCLNGVGV